MDALSAAADSIIGAGRRLGSRGLISAGEGNLSVRLDDDRLLVTPTGRRKDELEPDDLVVVWLGHTEQPRTSRSGLSPTSDLADPPRGPRRASRYHRCRARPPAGGDGAHPRRRGSGSAALPETALFLPRLPYLTLGVPGSAELAERIAAALSEPPEPLPGAVLLERHGAVAVGTNLVQAVDRIELVEVLCRTWRDAF